MDLIKITYNGDQPVVSARELYEWLEVKTAFRHWMPRMFEYGFDIGSDYTPVIFDHPQNGQQIQDFALTLDCAKEISMIQRTDKGKAARQYFIAKEKELMQLINNKSPAEAFMDVAKYMIEQERINKEAKMERQQMVDQHSALSKEVTSIKAKIEVADNYFTVMAHAKNSEIRIPDKVAAKFGREASKICRQRNIVTGTYPHAAYGSLKTYPVEILDEVFKEHVF